MPVWLEMIVTWLILGSVINLVLFLLGRKKGYFRWIDDTYTNSIYNRGYEDAKAEMERSVNIESKGNIFSRPRIREYGIKDNRYK